MPALPKPKIHPNLESGFWRAALHVDMKGLWANSSLSTPKGVRSFMEYDAPIRAQDVLARVKAPPEKYEQSGSSEPWDGVVLAGQITRDKSISSVTNGGGADPYWQFVRDAVKYYGKRLLIKHHPYSNGADRRRHETAAATFGATCEDRTLDCIDNCEFLLVFSSTCSIDAMLRGVPVLQYAPGYFSGTGAVTFTNWDVRGTPQDLREEGQRLVDFLMWRYCFHRRMPEDWWARVKSIVRTTKKLFPMPEKVSYGGFYRHCKRSRDQTYFRTEGAVR